MRSRVPIYELMVHFLEQAAFLTNFSVFRLRLDIQVIVGAVGVGGGHHPVKVVLVSSLLDGLPIEGVRAAAGKIDGKGSGSKGVRIYSSWHTVNRGQ